MDRGNPQFSECRVSQCRPSGVRSHYLFIPLQRQPDFRVSGILFLKVRSPAIVGEHDILCETRPWSTSGARRQNAYPSVAKATRPMKTEDKRTCPSCGNEFSGALEFCPVCMLRKALAGGVESGESSAFEDTVEPTPEQAVQRFGHYELVTGENGKPVELGRGAMGVTYKAIDVDLRCAVTLKLISEKYLGDESTRLRFLRA